MSEIPMAHVVIIGSGGHAKVVAGSLIRMGRKIIGLVDPKGIKGENKFGYEIIGSDEMVCQFSHKDIVLANGIGFMPGSAVRWEIGNLHESNGYKFITVIDPTAVVAEPEKIAEGAQILSGAIIQPGSVIGHSVIVNTSATIDHDCSVGAYSHIATGAILAGNVTVGERCFIGAGSVLIQGIQVGNDVVIAAGTVVYRDVPDRTFLRLKRKNITENLSHEA